MIGTYKFFAIAALVNQLGATMSANIMEGSDRPVLGPYQHDRLPGDFNRLHVTDTGYLMRETGEHPVVTKNDLLLQLEKVS